MIGRDEALAKTVRSWFVGRPNLNRLLLKGADDLKGSLALFGNLPGCQSPSPLIEWSGIENIIFAGQQNHSLFLRFCLFMVWRFSSLCVFILDVSVFTVPALLLVADSCLCRAVSFHGNASRSCTYRPARPWLRLYNGRRLITAVLRE